jgi:hypothetical protein
MSVASDCLSGWVCVPDLSTSVRRRMSSYDGPPTPSVLEWPFSSDKETEGSAL